MGELNRLLGGHRVIGVEKHLVSAVFLGDAPETFSSSRRLKIYRSEDRVDLTILTRHKKNEV